MPEHTYKVIEIVGSSPTSWEDAAHRALTQASEAIRDTPAIGIELQQTKNHVPIIVTCATIIGNRQGR